MGPPVWLWIGLGLVVVVLPAVLLVTAGTQATPPDTDRINNVTSLTVLIAERARRTGTWPAWSGKRFVLSVVAYGDRKIERKEDARLLFAGYRRLDALPEVSAYAAVTPEALAGAAVAHLTSYAGRRNADVRYRLPAGETPDEPILADLLPPDGAIVGFASGRVVFLEHDDLGLGPGDPVVAGEGSRSPLLRALSSE